MISTSTAPESSKDGGAAQAQAFGGPTGPPFAGGPTGPPVGGGPTGPPAPGAPIGAGLVALLQTGFVSPAGQSLALLQVAEFFADAAKHISASAECRKELQEAAEHLICLSARQIKAL